MCRSHVSPRHRACRRRHDHNSALVRAGCLSARRRPLCAGEHTTALKRRLASGACLLVTEAKLSDLAAITAPTLIIAGDDNLVAVEHLEAMRTTLPDGQLAIVPGTSHGLPLEKPELVQPPDLRFPVR